MAREPQFPSDANVGSGSGSTGGGDNKKEVSGGSAAAVSAQARAHSEAASAGKRGKHLVTGAAIGIGSAAIVAALLYANRRNKGGHGSNG
ncbi:MAG TPA: hypothetical protein VIA98_04020 [Allosphingosinicella sp.]|jgi:hypothetical protein